MAEDTPQTLRNFLEVPFGDRQVTVKELSLRQFQALGAIVSQVEDLGKMLGQIETLEAGAVIATIGKLFTTAPDIVAKIISTATDMSEDEVMDGTLTDILEVVGAVIQVNNFMETFKKKVKNNFPSK